MAQGGHRTAPREYRLSQQVISLLLSETLHPAQTYLFMVVSDKVFSELVMRLRLVLAAGLVGALLVVVPFGQAGARSEVSPTEAATPAETTPRRVRRDVPLMGAQYYGVWGDRTDRQRRVLLDKLKRHGVRWVRVGIPWGMVQPRQPTGTDPGWNTVWGLPRVDKVMRMAHRRGIKVSATLSRTPGWANEGKGPEYLPDRLSDYARVARFLAHRYRKQVASWEVWNEPNHDGFLRGAGPARYTRLLCRAYPALKAGSPRAAVVFGGTSGNDWRFINRAYRAGAKPCFDVLAVHPYNGEYSPRMEPPGDQQWWFQNVPLVRRVMLRHGDRRTRLWFTEVGWSTHRNTPDMPGYMRGVTRRQQARYLVDMLRITKRRYPYVTRVSWFSSKDENNGDIENDNFGLFTLRMRAKPSAVALRRFMYRN
jgi:polysaccharide biosynthesis protein PslG